MKNKKKIAQLTDLSFTKGKLDPRKISAIATTISGRELAQYYKLLLSHRERETVFVTSAIDMPQTLAVQLKKLFPKKEVFFKSDPSLLAGMRVKFADLIFNASLSDYLAAIKQNYEID